MKNLNRDRVMPIIFLALIYGIGCAGPTTTAPKGWLPSVATAQHESYGGWISVKYHTGDSESEVHGELIVIRSNSESEVRGELIAIRSNQVLILTSQELTSISADSISRMELTSVQLANDETMDSYRQMIYPAKPLDAFRAYARFPQGLSKAIDMQFLKPKKREVEISIPTEALESPQKDQSMPLIPLDQQNSVQADAVAAAERDANTYVNTARWFRVGFCGGGVKSARRHEPSLPAGQLLGKSPEYVAFYAAAYHAKAKRLQVNNATMGHLTGGIIYCLSSGLVILIVSQ